MLPNNAALLFASWSQMLQPRVAATRSILVAEKLPLQHGGLRLHQCDPHVPSVAQQSLLPIFIFSHLTSFNDILGHRHGLSLLVCTRILKLNDENVPLFCKVSC